MSHSNSLEQFSKSLIKPYTFLKVLSNQEFFKKKCSQKDQYILEAMHVNSLQLIWKHAGGIFSNTVVSKVCSEESHNYLCRE